MIMTIVRWNPLREIAAMQSAMDRFFDDSWRSIRSSGDALMLDVHETETEYRVMTSLPGVKPEDVTVSLNNDVLTITAETRQEVMPENSKPLLMERSYGKIMRSIRLPVPVVSDKIEAVLENGVLRLTLPKTPESQPRQIPVRVQPSKN
jgi:HSP20 family protein